MSTEDFIIELFYRADEKLKAEKIHSQAKLHKSEIVALALLFALKGTTCTNFYRWLKRDYLSLFPNLPERTRLFRLFKTHQILAHKFLAETTLIGVTDSFGIEFCHPIREKRFPDKKRIGKKGKSNSRWIVGGKLCVVLNKFGQVVDFSTKTANVADKEFNPMLKKYEAEMIIFADTGFADTKGMPENVKLCKRGTWNDRMVVEGVFSLLTRVCQSKKMNHKVWSYFEMRMSFLMAVFNLLILWNGMVIDNDGYFHHSIKDFML
jgi:hypothetical protein